MNKQLGAIAAFAAAAGLSAAVAAPTASAKSGGHMKLSVLPLPKSSLGSAARRLRLQHDSGLRPNPRIAIAELPLSPNHSFTASGGPLLAKLGRVSGYALDYGVGTSGSAGITEVWTSVDLYKTRADAKSGLAFWKRADRTFVGGRRGNLDIATQTKKAAPVGSRRFAFRVHYDATNIAPLFGVDEQFTQGSYEADVTVWGGSVASVDEFAPKLAGKLEARIKLALAGRLHAKPVELPPAPKAGPPPGGQDLAPLGLTPTDLGVQASAWEHGYLGNSGLALSYYSDMMAGQFGIFSQDIEWFATANQASFTADLATVLFGDATSINLSSVGDGAEGALATNPSGGDTAQLIFSSRRLLENVDFYSYSPISTSKVQNIAQTVANKINSAGLGS